jgi:CheY-like chemotaxis protein
MDQSKPKHILLVEDYDPVRELIANMLEDRGYRVSTAPDWRVNARFPAD